MPGGTWVPAQTGTGRPGPYLNFVGAALANITLAARGIAATIVHAPWGPDNAVQQIFTYGDILNFYTNVELISATSYNQWFTLHNILDGGASSIFVYRIEGSGAAQSTFSLQDTQGSPANAITLKGKFKGQYGNQFTITTQANAVDSTKTDVILLIAGIQTATWTNKLVNRGTAGHMADIVSTINNDPANFWLTATLVGADSGTTLSTPASVTKQALSGGADGAAPLIADFSTAQAALEGNIFSVYSADWIDADVVGLMAQTVAWVSNMRGYGKRVQWVTGSAAGESATTAVTNAGGATYGNREYVIYTFPGVYAQNALGVKTLYRGSAFAAQVAGMVAGLAFGQGLTYRQLANVIDLETRLNNFNITLCDNGGVLTLIFDGSTFKIDKGVNTLVAPATNQPPSMKKISVMNTLDAIANSITNTCAQLYVGKIPNDTSGQKNLLSSIRAFLAAMAGSRAITTTYSAALDTQNVSQLDRVFVTIGLTPIDTMDYIYMTVNVGAS